jgi:NADPH2:quinone reductase
VPAEQAVQLPDEVSDQIGACLGIPGITAHRAVFGDAPVAGKTILVQGVLGAVGSVAAQLGRWGGARVIGTVTRASDLDQVDGAVAHAVALDQDQADEAIRAYVPEGAHRIIEVAFSENADLDAAVAAPDAVIAAYATRRDRPDFPFWPILFCGRSHHRSTRGSTLDTERRSLALDHIVEAHDRVDAGTRERVLLAIPS